MCGLKTKLLCPDFVDIVQNHDISFFAETKLTDFDCVNLPPNYVCKTKNRSKFQKASGGLAIIYNNNLAKYLNFMKLIVRMFSGFIFRNP